MIDIENIMEIIVHISKLWSPAKAIFKCKFITLTFSKWNDRK